MKRWQRELGYLREVGPDEPHFRNAVKFLWHRILQYEEEVDALRRALTECQERGGEGE